MISDTVKLHWAEKQAIRNVCCITMVKNDQCFIRSWILHYIRNIKDIAFVIIDHASDYPVKEFVAEEFPGVEIDVIRMPDILFDDVFKSSALSALAGIYLTGFKTVIVSDVDELVIPLHPRMVPYELESLIDDIKTPFTSPIGMSFIHNTAVEDKYDFSQPLLNQRNYCRFSHTLTKPIIWKGKAACFTPGQHSLREELSEINSKLGLAHLNLIDKETKLSRQLSRNNIKFSDNNIKQNYGSHWSNSLEIYSTRFDRLSKTQSFGNGLVVLKEFLSKIESAKSIEAGGFSEIVCYSDLYGEIAR